MARRRFSQLELEDAGEAAPAARPTAGAPARPPAISFMAAARAHWFAGRHEKALAAYTEALRQNPLLVDAWLGQLWMLLDLGEAPEAALWADKALASFPDHPDLVSLKAMAFWRMGKRDDALALNDRALELRSDAPHVWLARSAMFLSLGRASAEGCVRHALKSSPDQAAAHLRLGDCFLDRRNYAGAVGHYREVLAAEPQAAWAHYQAGRAEEALGFPARAREHFAQAARLVPAHPRYRLSDSRKSGGLWERLSRLWRR